MPKVIENVRETILQEAKRQVLERGYTSMTIRSVAKSCGVAVGTIYNYFPSKDMLTAGFMLTDWQEAASRMRAGCLSATAPETALRCVYEALLQFMKRYEPLFCDSNAAIGFAAVFRTRHGQLRAQLAAMLERVCERWAKGPSPFLPLFLAESLLSWAAEKQDFLDLRCVLMQLFTE